MAKIIDVTDWWVAAQVWKQTSAVGEQPEEIASGELAEMVSLACSLSEAERQRVFISSAAFENRLTPDQMLDLSGRPDFPVFL